MSVLPAYRPNAPFAGRILGGFRPSYMVRIRGRVNGHGRCVIDFVNTPNHNSSQDVMFHISIRPSDHVIVRNHFQRGQWGMEERYGDCKVRRNETFEIIILAEMQHYKIAVNGHHLGVFRHRLPLHLVQFVQVGGDVTIDHVLLEQDMRSSNEQMILSNVVATPAMPQSFPGHVPMQVHIHHHPSTNPPPYNPHYNPPHNEIFRAMGISIEKRHGASIAIKKNNRNIFTF